MTIHITTATQLQNINNDTTADYVLDNDIDLTGVPWVPIGYGTSQFGEKGCQGQFVGTFDGQGFKISNLTCNNTKSIVGLFGFVGNASITVQKPIARNGVIKNLNLENVSLVSSTLCSFFGGIAGFVAGGEIQNCRVKSFAITASELSPSDMGGICGDLFNLNSDAVAISKVLNCSVDGFTLNGHNYIGGLVGYVSASLLGSILIDQCFVVGLEFSPPAGPFPFNIGGLFGFTNLAKISNCYVKGTLTFNNTEADEVGGFSGEDDGSQIINSYSDVTITDEGSTDFYACGGFVGLYDNGEVKNCYAVGVITGASSFDNIGGFIGDLNNTVVVENCSWFTGAFTWAVGSAPSGNHKSLTVLGVGTDESDNTKFYKKTHTVYAQGGSDAWDITQL